MRSYPAKYGFYLNEFDPYFDYRATQYIIDHGVGAYLTWHDDMSWYPEGRDVAATSQSALHITTAYLYKAFGGGSSLLDFVIIFPVVVGSLTVIVVFALVRVLGGTTAGLFSALLFSFSPAIIQRGNLGWFKSEPLGLFFGLLAVYLFISAMKHKEAKYAIAKAVGGGLLLGLANGAWGGIQYFSIPLAIFFLALPFFRKDLKIPMMVAIAFTIFALLSAAAFPRPGMSYVKGLPGLALIGGTIFLVAAYFVRRFSKPEHNLRNSFIVLGVFIIASGLLLGVGAYVSPSLRYLKAVNPFNQVNDQLVASVAEHFTPTVADYFTDYSILIMFAGLGVWMAFRRRDDVSIFALILGITGVYVSATFARLLVFASIGIIVLAGMGLYEVTRSILEYREATASAAPGKIKKKVDQAPRAYGSGLVTKAAYVIVIILMLTIPMFFPANSNWVSAADVPAAIANGGTGYRLQTNDWPDAMNWLATNTDKNAVVASWWDYGYWITTLGHKKTLADNATINSTRIAQIARMLGSDEQTGVKLAQDMHTDYILIYGVARLQFFGKANQTSANGTHSQVDVPVYSLGQGGDESKKQWFFRIGGLDESKYIEQDGFTPTPAFWNNTLLGKMLPWDPLYYAQVGANGQISNLSPHYSAGYQGLYGKHVKYPAGGKNQPLELVYSSPSFNNDKNGLVFGVFVYKVNHNYVPHPPVAQQSNGNSTTGSTNSTSSGNNSNLMTPSNKVAVINTTQGVIKIEFFPNAAPNHVNNFMKLANSSFYDGTIFHRIVPGFVIQGGDPYTKPDGKPRELWGTGGANSTVNAEFNSISHTRGIVSMARSADPNSASSQFFIVLKDSTFLDGKYTVFGKVIQGMDVVDKIAALQTMNDAAHQDQPVDPNAARILSVKIEPIS